MYDRVPKSVHITINRRGFLTYLLATSQVLPITREVAFTFFEDPRNLCDITPAWLDFCMLNTGSEVLVHENAEFDYSISFLGIHMVWRSRIIDYRPPERFTDIQLKGPYKEWTHVHILEEHETGTLMKDEVTYRLYLPALILHPLIIRRKLMDIFTYRAVKIMEWADNTQR